MDITKDIKHETMSDDIPLYIHGMKKSHEPLDLSRRCDSVESLKRLSPFSSGSGSPTMESTPAKGHHNYSVRYSDHSPPHHLYQSMQTWGYAAPKRGSPSPDAARYHVSRDSQQTCDLTPFAFQAATLQQCLSQRSREGDDVSETGSLNKQLLNSYPLQMIVGRDGKVSRPFKAYPRDPLGMASLSLVNAESAEKFGVFRMNMLKQIHEQNGGQPTVSNPKMRRTSSKAENTSKLDSETMSNDNCDEMNNGVKDSAYYERRKKNNAAAKKSRDRRRIKEDEIAIRAAYLEAENRHLHADVKSSKQRIAEMKIEIAELQRKLAISRATN